MVQFAGKYKLTKEEHYEDFLKAIKVNALLAKAARAASQTLEVTQEGPNKYRVTTTTLMRTINETFEFGKTFDRVTGDGRKVEATYSIDGDTWTKVEKNKNPGGPDVKSVSVHSDEGIDSTIYVNDVVCKIFYKRQ